MSTWKRVSRCSSNSTGAGPSTVESEISACHRKAPGGGFKPSDVSQAFAATMPAFVLKVRPARSESPALLPGIGKKFYHARCAPTPLSERVWGIDKTRTGAHVRNCYIDRK